MLNDLTHVVGLKLQFQKHEFDKEAQMTVTSDTNTSHSLTLVLGMPSEARMYM